MAIGFLSTFLNALPLGCTFTHVCYFLSRKKCGAISCCLLKKAAGEIEFQAVIKENTIYAQPSGFLKIELPLIEATVAHYKGLALAELANGLEAQFRHPFLAICALEQNAVKNRPQRGPDVVRVLGEVGES